MDYSTARSYSLHQKCKTSSFYYIYEYTIELFCLLRNETGEFLVLILNLLSIRIVRLK